MKRITPRIQALLDGLAGKKIAVPQWISDKLAGRPRRQTQRNRSGVRKPKGRLRTHQRASYWRTWEEVRADEKRFYP